jgi:hypothetical protein
MFNLKSPSITDTKVIDQWYSEGKDSFTWVVELASGHEIWCCYAESIRQIDFYVLEPGADKMIDIGEERFERHMTEERLIEYMHNWVLDNLGIEA